MGVSLHLRSAIAAHYSEEARSQWFNSTDVEWEALTHEAVISRLAPLLYYSLKKFPREDVPDASLEHLRTVYYATAARNMQMHQQLKRVTDALDEIGIHYILLKGAALIQDVYEGNMALRPMSDIDILIDPKMFPSVRKKLLEFSHLESVVMDDAINTAQHARVFYFAGNCRFEIHTRLVSYHHYVYHPKFNTLGARERLDINWTFLYLCTHELLHHNGSSCRFGADAALIIQLGVHWSKVIELAQNNHMIIPLQWGIEILKSNWFSVIPDNVRDQVSTLQSTYLERFFFTCSQHPPLRRFGIWLALPSIQVKLAYLYNTFLPSKKYLEEHWANEESDTHYSRLYFRRLLGKTYRTI